jgi:exodeoxyribonuclease V alpha subunit
LAEFEPRRTVPKSTKANEYKSVLFFVFFGLNKDFEGVHKVKELNEFTELSSTGVLSPLDVHFAGLLTRLHDGQLPELALAAAMVSSTTRQGHICLDLHELGGKRLGHDPREIHFPDVSDWCEKLRQSNVVGHPGEFKPLILDAGGRLYLYRYWDYQQKLVEALRPRIAATNWQLLEPESPKARLEQMFPSGGRKEVDWQKVAAFTATWRNFCVISGGPGTGKTTTVAKILVLLLQEASPNGLRIALTAPTGKAAARLQEAINGALEKLECPEWIRRAVPGTASTIHRMLGAIRGSPYFRHDQDNPLPVDLVVVDEASMVDLALMSKLLQALPSPARLILLGDQDQLASVEAGAVLGDICETGEKAFFSRDFSKALQEHCDCELDPGFISDDPSNRPKDCIVQLQKSYRFSDESGIGLLSQAVRSGDADGTMGMLRDRKYQGISWNATHSGGLLDKARDHVVEGLESYFRAVGEVQTNPGGDPYTRMREIFDLFENFRVLCAVREGPCGVAALNSVVEHAFQELRLLRRDRNWYVGRPVLIARNDYSLGLFNGDVGIFLPDVFSGGDSRVFFPGREGKFRPFHPLRLPEHETVYAMTVHKSQGSEFNNVMFILPDKDSQVLTRELVYTAITRARNEVALWGPESLLRTAISRTTRRMSGLSEALWKSTLFT